MRKVIGIGETILDIIFKDEQPAGATPGGSVFNCLVTLGRMKKYGEDYQVFFVSDIGQDRVGNLICDFMERNGVSSSYVNKFPSAKTAVSLAFLDKNNDADYTFFKDYSLKGLQGDFPQPGPDDIVIFGSFYALNPVLRDRMKLFIESASRAGALIYYDVNFRKSHSYEAEYLQKALVENYEFADIVRGSKDDFMALYDMDDSDIIYREKISPHTDHFIFTAGADETLVRMPGKVLKYPVPPVTTVSTVGAGDNFNAGIIYGLLREGIRRSDLNSMSSGQWDRIVYYAQRFSVSVCQSLENYVGTDFELL